MPQVEDGGHSSCLGDAKMHEALLEVRARCAGQRLLVADAQDTYGSEQYLLSMCSGPASQQVRRSAEVIVITSLMQSTMSRTRERARSKEDTKLKPDATGPASGTWFPTAGQDEKKSKEARLPTEERNEKARS